MENIFFKVGDLVHTIDGVEVEILEMHHDGWLVVDADGHEKFLEMFPLTLKSCKAALGNTASGQMPFRAQ